MVLYIICRAPSLIIVVLIFYLSIHYIHYLLIFPSQTRISVNKFSREMFEDVPV